LNREKAAALAETTATALLWGTSFPVIGYGIRQGLDPKLFVFLRFAAAAPIMLVITRLLRKPILPSLKSRGVWMLGFLNAVGFVSQFLGQAYTDASVAALLVNLSVLIAAIGSAALLQERFTKAKLIGTTLAVLGILLLTTGGNPRQLANSQLLGDALYLVSAITWGIYIIYNKRKTDEAKYNPVSVASSIIVVTAVFTAPMILFTAQGGISLSLTEWLIIGYTAVFNTALPFTLYQLGLRFLTATSSAMVLMLEILAAVAISVTFLGEALTSISIPGAALIILSIFLVSGTEIVGKSLSVPYSNSSEVRQVP
jgi:drug/metabolite transporter (DMT)-like permease